MVNKFREFTSLKFKSWYLVSFLGIGLGLVTSSSSNAYTNTTLSCVNTLSCRVNDNSNLLALATITVTNTADSGAGSLRQAIANAQSGDTIKFSSSLINQIITLTSGQLNINKNLIIDGSDAPGLKISGNNASRVFLIAGSTNVTIKNLIITNGKLSGTDPNNEATSAGAGIQTGGQSTLTLANCQINNNVAGFGGGLYLGWRSNTTITNCKFTNNNGSYAANTERGGGAIAVKSGSTLSIKSSRFAGNIGSYGGAINNLLSSLTVENSRFINNKTNQGVGGAIYTDGANASGVNSTPGSIGGNIIIRGSWFEGNIGVGEGGAAFLFGYLPDKIILQRSTFINNQAIKNSLGKGGSAGGVRVGNAELTVIGCTFANNTAQDHGGGLWIGEKGNVKITNSTFYNNTAAQQGGAILLANDGSSSTNIINTTIANNYAGGYGGAVSIFDFNGTVKPVSVKNSIFYQNTAGNPWKVKQQTSRLLIDAGRNIQFPNKLTTNDPNDNNVTPTVVIVNPSLGVLANNGGSTQTMMLLDGSPAINSGTNDGCPSIDQRNVSRPLGGICDIGAVEAR